MFDWSHLQNIMLNFCIETDYFLGREYDCSFMQQFSPKKKKAKIGQRHVPTNQTAYYIISRTRCDTYFFNFYVYCPKCSDKFISLRCSAVHTCAHCLIGTWLASHVKCDLIGCNLWPDWTKKQTLLHVSDFFSLDSQKFFFFWGCHKLLIGYVAQHVEKSITWENTIRIDCPLANNTDLFKQSRHRRLMRLNVIYSDCSSVMKHQTPRVVAVNKEAQDKYK